MAAKAATAGTADKPTQAASRTCATVRFSSTQRPSVTADTPSASDSASRISSTPLGMEAGTISPGA